MTPGAKKEMELDVAREPGSVSETMPPFLLHWKRIAHPHFLNSASWVGARTVSGLARVGILLAIARVYGPEQFGQLSLAISVVEILRAFSEFGIDTISIRKFAQTTPERRSALLAGIAGAKLLLGSCFYILGVGVLFLIADRKAEILLGAIAALTLLFVSVLGAISSYLQSFLSMSRILRTAFWSSAAAIVFAALAIAAKAPLPVVVASLPLADGINLLLLWRTSGTPLSLRFNLSETAALLRQSLPVGIMVALVVLYFRLDNIFLFKLAGAAALGLYAASYRIIEPALMVPHSFSTTAYTALAAPQYQTAGLGLLTSVLWRTMWPSFAFIAAAAVGAQLGGRVFLARFFPTYLPAYPVLMVLIYTLSVRTLNISLTAVLNSRAQYSVLTKIAVVNLLFNLGLVLVLIPRWGALGAAFAALATESLNTLLQARSLIAGFASSKPQLVPETPL